jgi:hypothetical protein
VFCPRKFFEGRTIHDSGAADIAWFGHDGVEMVPDDWNLGFAKSLAAFLNGSGIPEVGRYGGLVTDDSFDVLINAHFEELFFAVPGSPWGRCWERVISTSVASTPATALPAECTEQICCDELGAQRRRRARAASRDLQPPWRRRGRDQLRRRDAARGDALRRRCRRHARRVHRPCGRSRPTCSGSTSRSFVATTPRV